MLLVKGVSTVDLHRMVSAIQHMELNSVYVHDIVLIYCFYVILFFCKRHSFTGYEDIFDFLMNNSLLCGQR